jgi:uncharacterized surface protein with fasciclin (FAS1) repeats
MSHRFFLTAVAVVALGVTAAAASAPRLADAMPVAVSMAGPTQLGGALTNPNLPLFDSLNTAGGFSIFSHLMVDAELTDTLNGPDAYTVFAVPDDVFHKLPEGELNRLSKPDNKTELVKLAAYHIIKGRLESGQIFAAIEGSPDGKALFRTVQGENITFQRSGQVLEIRDAHGDLADIVVADIPQANGLIYVLDHPLTPK